MDISTHFSSIWCSLVAPGNAGHVGTVFFFAMLNSVNFAFQDIHLQGQWSYGIGMHWTLSPTKVILWAEDRLTKRFPSKPRTAFGTFLGSPTSHMPPVLLACWYGGFASTISKAFRERRMDHHIGKTRVMDRFVPSASDVPAAFVRWYDSI